MAVPDEEPESISLSAKSKPKDARPVDLEIICMGAGIRVILPSNSTMAMLIDEAADSFGINPGEYVLVVDGNVV